MSSLRIENQLRVKILMDMKPILRLKRIYTSLKDIMMVVKNQLLMKVITEIYAIDEVLKRQIISSMMMQGSLGDKPVKKIKIDLLISSNLRVSVALRDSKDTRHVVGNPLNAPFLTEHHVISFERYINMPAELRKKMIKEGKKNTNDDKIETVNPWLITDIDYTSGLWKNPPKF